MNLLRVFVLILLASFLAIPPVQAGSSQAEGEAYFDADTIIGFSKRVEKSLAANGARVAIISRVGRPRTQLPEGVRFTHTALAVYSKITTSDGRNVPGYAIYNLYQKSGRPDKSHLVKDYPVDFFAGVQVLEAGVIIPTPDLQRRLLDVVASDTYQNLHNPDYSVIANPYTLKLQNCTEHVLDILFSAIYKTDDIQQIKANQKAYFKAQPVHVNPIKLALGSLFVKDVATSDHPGSPETTTFTTIGNFLEKFGLAAKVYVISESV
ncbi:MAG TPA: DUF2145 domain-containing protein [Desulfobacteraceae bacterium]|nr:DUF2145 domain-containing protein [Desulfobacteraceae bacterium]